MALLVLVSCASPATRTRSISATSLSNAIKAATKAAREIDFVVKTVDKGNGYIYAERDAKVIGRSGRADSYKLEIDINPSAIGKMDLSVKVTPPPGIIGGLNPENVTADFLKAFRKHLM